MVSRRNLRLRIYNVESSRGEFTGTVLLFPSPCFWFRLLRKQGDRHKRTVPLFTLVYKQISNSLSTSNGGVSGGREEGYTLVVTNNAGYELPSTGGPGTRLFTIFGSTLILGAGVLLWRRRMRWHNALTQCG